MLSIGTTYSGIKYYVTETDVDRERYILINRNSFRVQFIIIIYIESLTNTLIFGSIVAPLYAWLLGGAIALILEKAPNICLQIFKKLICPNATIVDYFNILYLCRHLIGVALVFTLLVLITLSLVAIN